MNAQVDQQGEAAIVAASFVKIGSNGDQLPSDATDHVAVLDRSTGLMWSAGNVSDRAMTWNDATGACVALSLAGFDDWRLPTAKELFTLADHTRVGPAIDTQFFPTTKSDWYWSGTPYASSSGYAWYVNFYYGDSYWYDVFYEAFVRAVRAPSQ